MPESAVAATDIPALREALREGILSEVEFRGENTLNLSLEALPKALEFCNQRLVKKFWSKSSYLNLSVDDPRFELD